MQRPNIVILYTDQQRWDAVGVNGNSEIRTPRLDQLATEGVNLDHYFVQSPVCMPSRLSFLTSRYCSQLGIFSNGTRVPEGIPNLATYLRNYGYVCGNMGKLHFLPHANRNHMNPHPAYDFHRLVISDEPGCYEDAYRAWVRRQAPEQMDRISLGLPPARETWEAMMGREPIIHLEREKKCAIPFAADKHLTHTAFVADETMSFIREHQSQPFLAIAGFYSPHAPWITPQKYLDLYDPQRLSLPAIPDGWDSPQGREPISEAELRSVRQGYYGMVSEVDDHVGSILDCLDELALTEETIVLFISDHGEYLGDYHTYGKGAPGQDCISRVPCIARWPGHIEMGVNIHDLTEAVDVVPTLLEAAGIPVPTTIQGRSVLSRWRGKVGTGSRESTLTECVPCKSLRTAQHRYVCYRDGSEDLYDIARDPGEYENVIESSEYSSALTDHRKMMIEKLLQTDMPHHREFAY
ncbi:MAG: sulfatase-like hydrolase/transferase [Candidatus Latescibacterota bacterium]|nr:sulfatase-like hydrolase/transferase [Candidatus Latescibacterota bacterium]